MSEQSVNRRGVLMAAANIGALMAVADAHAGDGTSRAPLRDGLPASFKLSVKLPDGQVLAFNAAEATIDLGTQAQLVVTPTGVVTTLLATDASPTPLRPTPSSRSHDPAPSSRSDDYIFNEKN